MILLTLNLLLIGISLAAFLVNELLLALLGATVAMVTSLFCYVQAKKVRVDV